MNGNHCHGHGFGSGEPETVVIILGIVADVVKVAEHIWHCGKSHEAGAGLSKILADGTTAGDISG